MSEPSSPRRRPDGLDVLFYSAAVFWFAVVSGLYIVTAVIAMPLACFGDPAPGSAGACPTGLPPYAADGSLVRVAVAIVGVVILSIVAWWMTNGRATARAVMMLMLATIAMTLIVVAFATESLLGVVAVVWLGMPAVLLAMGGTGAYRRGSSAD